MWKCNRIIPEFHRHHHFHAHFPVHLWHLVRRGSSGQRLGHLRGGCVQEKNGVGHLRAQLGHSRHAFPLGDAFQHPSAGPRQAVGLRELHVQGGGGGGCEQPVHHRGNSYRTLY